MNKEQIIEKLKELGIISSNCYPKNSFVKDYDVYIGCYSRELADDFYFYNGFDKSIYKISKYQYLDKWSFEQSTGKYLIPKSDWEEIWVDKPFEELADQPFRDITVRQYACIHLKVPKTGLVWLDEIIKQAK